MRMATAYGGLAFLVLAAGCNTTGWNIFNGKKMNDTAVLKEAPSVAQLVDYLNQNAELVTSMRCDEIDMKLHQGAIPISLDARMIAQQPRNFRMQASLRMSGQSEVDLGSNEKEFWYWIGRAKPAAQFHCSYAALDSGNVKVMPLPIQPTWIMEALCMTKFGPPEKYQLIEGRDELRLVERAKSPQGQPVKKVIVFNRRRADLQRGEPQIKAFLLIDEKTGKEICAMHIHSIQLDRPTGAAAQKYAAVLPKYVELRFTDPTGGPSASLTMRFRDPVANVEIPPNFAAFQREPLPGYPSFDLARGQWDGQPSSLQQAGSKISQR